ncbi:hypothetical protein AAFF_G00036420 [Aldrovandia affinis]|uniref:Uncharacterized protein n=1 Tax=Aldrovandia affinis TaxID=143900 RepID=A0AAD7WFH5_9TELE|nr:hypothetical protein AAFF_G00036420 [Aldrovandia affinis]
MKHTSQAFRLQAYTVKTAPVSTEAPAGEQLELKGCEGDSQVRRGHEFESPQMRGNHRGDRKRACVLELADAFGEELWEQLWHSCNMRLDHMEFLAGEVDR